MTHVRDTSDTELLYNYDAIHFVFMIRLFTRSLMRVLMMQLTKYITRQVDWLYNPTTKR